ncbi:MAG: phenylalanine--tRNA ligase subunit beta [Thermomicrobiales bacterium]
MKVPMSWLNEIVDTGLPVKELAHRLTMAGLEAEKFEVIGERWDNVYVGYVEKVERHPDADRLVLASVNAGEHHLTVVTGAPNIAQGQKVALALAGARLYDGHSEEKVLKTLKPGVIRGIKSEGMVCSEKELGMSDEHEGILVLDQDAPVGAPLIDYLGDTVIEFEITPNLVHAFSVIGIAREAAALTGAPMHLPDAPNLSAAPAAPADLITIEDPDLCPRYVAAIIEGLSVEPSPAWLQRRLLAAGLRPISNIVDVTNYVMLEYGQPLHAFDRDHLAGGRIIVRRAKPGEAMETLDHTMRQFGPDMLVIADAEKPVGIAGVMGGLTSEVSDTTTTIVLEAANFDMKNIRATSKALRLRSDASARFERGIDPSLPMEAAGRAVRLLMDLCPAARLIGVSDVYPKPVLPRDHSLPFGEIERLLGVAYPAERVLDALSRLGFGAELDGDQLHVTIPSWRDDVTRPADIVEEVARLIGYETLPETLPKGETAPVRRDPVYLVSRGVRDALVGAGGFETINYVTVGDDHLAAFSSDGLTGFQHCVPVDRVVRLVNPLQSERGILRPTLIPSLIESLSTNLRHEPAVRLFEIARVYLPSSAELPEEPTVAGVAIAGRRDPLGRFASDGDLDFFDLKGMVESVLSQSGVMAHFQPATHPALHPGRSAACFVGERQIGLLGELRPDVAAAFGIEGQRVGVAELDIDAILATAKPVSGVKTPRFLPVQQDFAVVVPSATPAAEVQAALLAGAGALATDIALFDVYQGPQVGEGCTSLAFRVTFTAPDRALTDAELLKVRERIAKNLKQRVDGELRA